MMTFTEFLKEKNSSNDTDEIIKIIQAVDAWVWAGRVGPHLKNAFKNTKKYFSGVMSGGLLYRGVGELSSATVKNILSGKNMSLRKGITSWSRKESLAKTFAASNKFGILFQRKIPDENAFDIVTFGKLTKAFRKNIIT